MLALARPAVAAVAPEELPLLEATAAAWPRRARGDEDELLGFGLDASVAVVSIAAVSAARAVVQLLGTAVVDAARDETSARIRVWMSRKVRRSCADRPGRTSTDAPAPGAGPDDETAEPAGPLTAEQLRRVRAVSHDRARAAGVSAGQAELIADAIVGGLSW